MFADRTTVPEMEAWLRERGLELQVTCNPRQVTVALRKLGRPATIGRGPTLIEALQSAAARLPTEDR